MKKNLALILVLVFIFSLAINLPVRAENGINSDTATTSATTTIDVTTPDSTLTSSEDSTNKTLELEKIPSPDYIKYFKEIIKKGETMYGVRLEQKSTTTSTTTDERINGKEKILTPEHIKFFDKITKVGNALFGVKKEGAKIEDVKKPENATTTNLEKIPSPENIKFFDKITKIGTALFGIRKDAPKSSEANDKTIQLPAMNTETITCVSAAIDIKDTSVTSAFTAATTEIASAMTVRGTCQKLALNLTSGDRQTEVAVCNKAFQETSKQAHETARNAQKEAWTTYSNSLKECSKKNTAATSTSEIKIEDGGQSISDVLVQ